MKLSIIIPVYNEYLTIREIVRRVLSVPGEKEVIIIDDGSTDGTKELLKKIETTDSRIRCIYNKSNTGKGYAVRCGLKYASGDIVIIQDADLEYSPAEYGLLTKKIEENRADIVIGSRERGCRRILYFRNHIGNRLINWVSSVILGINITDIGCGFKAVRRDILNNICLRADGFGFETEIIARFAKRFYRIYEVPISYDGRTYSEGKKTGAKTFFELFYWMIKAYFFSTEAGEDILSVLKHTFRYNRWIFSRIEPYVGRRVLEIGSGIGNISRFLIRKDIVVLTDINSYYLDVLRRRFIGNDEIIIRRADVSSAEDTASLKGYDFDTIIFLNVLEHIKDDTGCLRNLRNIMAEKTLLILLLPAVKVLYGSIDEALGHYRRYSKKELMALLQQAGFSIKDIFYHNMAGILGWFVKGRILRRKRLGNFDTKLFDVMVPALKRIESGRSIPFGLSLIVVCSKR